MKITVWSDFVCPFCYIGVANLETAINALDMADEVTVSHKSFQLDPYAEYHPERDFYDYFENDKGIARPQAAGMVKNIEAMAEEAGLDYHLETMKMTNTVLPHRVFQYAEAQGKGNDFFNRLYHAVFTESLHVADEDVLLALATEVGLEAEAVREIISDETQYLSAFQEDVTQASQLGAQGVPFFVINDKYSLSGAQPVDTFKQALTQIAAEDA